MIELIVDNTHKLDLPTDFSISVIQENPLMLIDRIPSPYTLSFDLPGTVNNLLVFNIPNRVASNGFFTKKPAEIRFMGFIIMRGEIHVSDAEKTIKTQFVGSIMPANALKKLNEIDMGVFNFGQVPVDLAQIDYDNPWAAAYKSFMANASLNGSPFVIAPIRVKDNAWEGETDEENGFYNTLNLYINYYNARDKVLYPRNTSRCHSPIMPAVYVKDIINAAFGDVLADSPFNTGDMAKLVIPTYNHKNYTFDNLYNRYRPTPAVMIDTLSPVIDDTTPISGNEDYMNFEFALKSFQQSYMFSDFLKDILKIFSLSAFPGTKWSIESNDSVMNRTIIKNWDDKIVGEPVVSVEFAKSYQFSFGSSKQEQTINKRKFACIDDLYSFAMQEYDNQDLILEDSSTGTIYKVNKITTRDEPLFQKILRCEIYKSPLSTFYPETQKEIYQVTPEVKPLDIIIEPFWEEKGPPLEKGHWLVPLLESNSSTDAPPIMIYWGHNIQMFPGLSSHADTAINNPYIVASYPYLTNNNVTVKGTKLFSFTLSPNGEDGLINTFHTSFKSWVEKDKKRLKVTVKLSASQIRNLNMRDKFHIRGRLFYIEKIEYQLRNSGFSLIEADMIEC